MQPRLPQNLSAALANYDDHDKDLVEEAFQFASKKHQGESRSSGEPYINHPVRVAVNLIEGKFDLQSVMAGLLHDVLENTDATYQELLETFGAETSKIVEGVTKVSSYKIREKSQVFSDHSLFLERVDNYKKILFAATSDPRVLIVKLFDRLDNIETIEGMISVKRKFYARETIEIFAPIAERLGMGFLKTQLEDRSFPYAYPDRYRAFIDQTAPAYQNTSVFINSIIPIVRDKVDRAGIKIISIAGRAKSHYSLYKKIQRKGSLGVVHDVLALRIIVRSVEDCYKTLGVIHSLYEPLPNKIKDYIAKPKINGYCSIHSTVKDKENNIFEIQIRTKEMHEAAENGALAHWSYKENNSDNSSLEWIRELEKLKTISGKREFLKELKENFFAHQIFTFTPKGDIVRMPVGATPIDFAYMIHSSLGHRTTGAKVNGKIVPLPTQLQTGDSVEIIVGKVLNPKEDWLKFVKTAQARHKIRTLTKLKHESYLIQIGWKKLCELANKYSLPAVNKAEADKILRSSIVSYNSLDKALVGIAEGNISAIKLLKTLYPKFKTTEIRHYVLTASDSLVIPALKNIPYELAKCCKPDKNDSVIGYLGKEPVIKIHKTDCNRLKNVDRRRLISLS